MASAHTSANAPARRRRLDARRRVVMPDDAARVVDRLAVEEPLRAPERGQLRVDADDARRPFGKLVQPAADAAAELDRALDRRRHPLGELRRQRGQAEAAARPVGRRHGAIAPVRVEIDREVLPQRLRLAVDQVGAPARQVGVGIGRDHRHAVDAADDRIAPAAVGVVADERVPGGRQRVQFAPARRAGATREAHQRHRPAHATCRGTGRTRRCSRAGTCAHRQGRSRRCRRSRPAAPRPRGDGTDRYRDRPGRTASARGPGTRT